MMKYWPPLLTFAAGLALACSLLGHLGRFYWILNIVDQFQIQMIYGSLAVAVLSVLNRNRVAAFLALGVIVSALVSVGPFLPSLFASHAVEQRGLRVVNFNVEQRNPTRSAAINWVQQQNADVVVLLEANEAWVPAIAPLSWSLPNQIRVDHPRNHGMMLLSRYPISSHKLLPLSWLRLPVITAVIETPSGPLRVVAVHTPTPTGEFASTVQMHSMTQIDEMIAQSSMPTLLLGDFNATPWSAPMASLRQRTDITGWHIRPSWPSGTYPIGIPLDQTLGLYGVTVTLQTLGPLLGGDHRAVVANVTVQR